MRFSPCGARLNVEVDTDAGYRDIPAGHHQPTPGTFYSLRQIAGRYGFPATRPDLQLPVRNDYYFLVTTLAYFTDYLTLA